MEKKGDIMILYTDGLTETKAPEGHMFGVKRLQNMIDHVNSSNPEVKDSASSKHAT